jgi:hypothetical protein
MAASRAGSRFHGTFSEDMRRAAESPTGTGTRRLAATAGRSIMGGESGEGDGSKPDSEWKRHGHPRV